MPTDDRRSPAPTGRRSARPDGPQDQPGTYGQPSGYDQPGFADPQGYPDPQQGYYDQRNSYEQRDPYRQPGYAPRPPAVPRQPGRGNGVYGSARRRKGRGNRLLTAVIVVVVLGLVAIGAGLRFLPGSPLAAGNVAATGPGTPEVTTPPPPPPPPPLPFKAAEVTAAAVGTKGFLSWALMDLRSGEIWGSTNKAATTTTMSLVKAWLAADYLRTHPKPTSAKLKDLELMIRNSDNGAAERIYEADGTRASITRAVSICGLTDSRPAASGKGFGYTMVSAEDAVRIAACIADGRAAGDGTEKLLGWMRSIRIGNFGPAKALPPALQAGVAMKNGWDIWHEDRTYRTNCMAFGDTWALAVMLQFPSTGSDENDLAHNSQVCADVATALRNPEVP